MAIYIHRLSYELGQLSYCCHFFRSSHSALAAGVEMFWGRHLGTRVCCSHAEVSCLRSLRTHLNGSFTISTRNSLFYPPMLKCMYIVRQVSHFYLSVCICIFIYIPLFSRIHMLMIRYAAVIRTVLIGAMTVLELEVQLNRGAVCTWRA